MFPSPLPNWMREDEYYNMIKKEFKSETQENSLTAKRSFSFWRSIRKER